MIKLILKGEEEGTAVVTDKLNALSQVIDCMQRNGVHKITVEYKNRGQADKCSSSE